MLSANWHRVTSSAGRLRSEKESADVIRVAMVVYDLAQSCCCHVIRCATSINVCARKEIKHPRFAAFIIFFLIDKDDEVIPQAVNFLLAVLVGAAGLGLGYGSDLDVRIDGRQVQAVGRASDSQFISLCQEVFEQMLDKSADSFSVCDTE